MHKKTFKTKDLSLKHSAIKALNILLFVFSALFSMSFKTPGSFTGIHKNQPENTGDSTKGFKTLLGSSTGDLSTDGHFELNPLAVAFVEDFINKQGGNLQKMKAWGQPYFTMYEKVLAAKGLPVELKYLSVVESSLQSGIVSTAGAAGPWQLMPDEARRFGLKVNNRYDERNNFFKSTEAAAKLLNELYGQFGDWLLVIAAYNAGAGGVKRAITKAKSDNFWDIQFYLPDETRNHVKKYIATHYFFEGSGGWTTLTASECAKKKLLLLNQQLKKDTVALNNTATIELSGKYNSMVIVKNLLMDIDAFNQMNPLFDKTLSEGKPYIMRLPKDKMEIFKNKRQLMLYESVQVLLSASIAEAGTR